MLTREDAINEKIVFTLFSASCDITVSSERAIIHSPGYPGDYPADSLCVYTVKRLDRGVCQVQVEFLDFDLEEETSCSSDFFQLKKNGDRYCGVQKPPTTGKTVLLLLKIRGLLLVPLAKMFQRIRNQQFINRALKVV